MIKRKVFTRSKRSGPRTHSGVRACQFSSNGTRASDFRNAPSAAITSTSSPYKERSTVKTTRFFHRPVISGRENGSVSIVRPSSIENAKSPGNSGFHANSVLLAFYLEVLRGHRRPSNIFLQHFNDARSPLTDAPGYTVP